MTRVRKAGNIELDKAGDLPQMKTHRKEGLLLMVEVEYKNSRPWWGVYPNYQDVSYVRTGRWSIYEYLSKATCIDDN